eukprot:TRINITY_DN3809_c0_g1_i3.p1 TRINITY_DN3809_c0_g1~~TRINITY_DN3809_c0_g1_i3.p1  ORF type:complete len:185 (+),score=41.42 TRINITY_DN3809_c0_g1_i3:75-629(+)
MSLAFLANKGFHPSNFANQRKVFIAEQKAADEAKKQKEREKQLKEEQSYMEAKKALSGVSTSEDSKRAVNFMYEPPPGYLTSLSAANAPKEEKKDDRPAWAKNAPVEGSYAAGMDLNVKPLGIEVWCISSYDIEHISAHQKIFTLAVFASFLLRILIISSLRSDAYDAFDVENGAIQRGKGIAK